MKKSSYDGVSIGRFDVLSAIGEGASGTVWIARDRALGIPVALKVLRSSLRNDERRRIAFEREARLCERMLSPHVVRVLKSAVDDAGVPHIAYELLDGVTLEEHFLAGGRLCLEHVEKLVVEVARGLARAHAIGVAHRDIKPSNIFVARGDRNQRIAKILDFGVATAVGTQGSDVYGTLEYIAPEVLLEGADADARGDLYALAVVAYECITGRVPFEAESLNEHVAQLTHASDPPSVAPAIGSAASCPLDAWFKIALDREPSQRMQTARELATTFHAVIKEAKRLVAAESASCQHRSPMGLDCEYGTATPEAIATRPRVPSFTFEASEPSEARRVSPTAPTMNGRSD